MFSYLSGYILFPIMEKYVKRDVSTKLKELRSYEAQDRETQKRIQRDKCFQLLQYCKQSVPYYRELFKEKSFDIDKVQKDIRFLLDIPILTKELVREHSSSIQAADAYHKRKTGGSTGQSVMFYYDNQGLDWTSAINLMAYEMAGKKPHHTDCHISADLELLGLGATQVKDRLRGWMQLRLMNRSKLNISIFNDEKMQEAVKELKRISPYLLQGHPSTVYAIANFLEQKNIKNFRSVTVFEPSGEVITEKMVKKIENNLNCRVVNRYGNAEFGVVAHSRPQDNYKTLKVFERAFFVEEVLQAPLVISCFTNYGFPLLRYDTGDVATVSERADGVYISDIQGRIHDVVDIDGKRYPTHFIMDCLDHKVGGVREFQIVVDMGNPVLNIIPERFEDAERILIEIKKVFPIGLDVQFVSFDKLIKVGERQKFRHVVNINKKIL